MTLQLLGIEMTQNGDWYHVVIGPFHCHLGASGASNAIGLVQMDSHNGVSTTIFWERAETDTEMIMLMQRFLISIRSAIPEV